MVLSDRDMIAMIDAGVLRITPFDRNLVQPASIDVRLADEIVVIGPGPPIDVFDDNTDVGTRHTIGTEGFTVYPGNLVIASTIEHVEVPSDMVARVEGKSSLARLGLAIHVTAGYIDPGFRGQVTLEVVNHTMRPIIIHAGMPVGQLSFLHATSHVL